MKYRKISVTLSHDAWRDVISALAVGITSDTELIKDLTNHAPASAEQEYLIKSYMDEVQHMRDAKVEIWRRLTE